MRRGSEEDHIAAWGQHDPLRAQSPGRGRPVPEQLCVDARGLAAMLGISVRHVRSLRARGGLPAPLSLGRRRVWRVDEVRAWLAAGMPARQAWKWNAGQR